MRCTRHLTQPAVRCRFRRSASSAGELRRSNGWRNQPRAIENVGIIRGMIQSGKALGAWRASTCPRASKATSCCLKYPTGLRRTRSWIYARCRESKPILWCSTACSSSRPNALDLAGEALAGHPFRGVVLAGQCVPIMTGAPMPRGTDAAVMQEQTRELDGVVRIGANHRPGQKLRRAGEDIATGDAVLEPCRTLTPADLGLLASLGIPEVSEESRPEMQAPR